jgi:amino acid adenylation domain-containing protein
MSSDLEDELVISHGQNHYPDIEQTAARSHPLLVPGGGAAFEVAERGEEQLVLVHEVSTPLAHPQEIFGTIRQAVAARHGLHTSRILLVPPGALPRNSTGKIQRRLVQEDYLAGRLGVVLASSVRVERGEGLPSAARTGDGTSSSGEEASHMHLVTYLRELSAQLLGVDATELDAQQPAAELGIDSLTSLEATHRIEQDLGVFVGPETVLGGSIAELADQIGAKREADATDTLATLPQLRQVGSPDGTRVPLSYQEEQLWYLAQETPWSMAYNETIRLHLVGHLNREALERSLNDVVRRHAALRTTFALQADGRPARVVSPHIPLSLTEVSLDPSTSLDQLCRRFGQRPFDLATGPLYRLALIQVAEHHHVLLLSLHHSIKDGQSWRILLQDLAALYQAHSASTRPSLPQPELAIDGTAYTLWQRNLLTGEFLTRLEDYWLQTLADLPQMELPTDFPRPSIQSFRGATLRFSLPPSLVPALRAFCQREGITSYMALLAAFQLLLARVSDQEDIVVGTLVHGRTRRELEPLVGMFASTLVLRTNLAGDPSVRDVLRRVRTAVLEAYAHQDLPFARLVERLCPERDPGRHPLFQVLFQMIPDPLPTLVVADLEMRAEEVDCGTAKFDLTLTIIEKAAGLEAVLEYSTDLFEEATIARLSMHYQHLLQALVSAPSDLQAARLPLMGADERERLLASWNERQGGTLPEACLHELFEMQAMRTPEAVAIVDGEECLSYRELDERANQLAHFLAEDLHVRPGSYVGLMLRRSAAMVVAILGILKAGGTCVPLDPETPPLRLSALVEDAGLSALLCQQHYQPRLSPPPCPLLFLDADWPRIAQAPRDPMLVQGEASARRVAIVLYTSGSTGRPKGVLVPHQAIASLVCPPDFVTITPTSRIAQASDITFDAASFEIWAALLNGARLVILPSETLLSPRLCRIFLQEQGISILFLTTSLFHLYARLSPDAFGGLETLIFGGETVAATALRAVLRQQHRPGRLVNIYGPTENTVCTTWYEVSSVADSASRIPIGRPLRHTQVYLLDRLLEPVPIGVPGELCIGGAGLALGYLNQPERTQERFIPHPFGPPGVHLYRSGDRVRLLPDGNFEFIERIDQQIKIRGHRIEPGEIETLLRQHPEVQDALVRVWEAGEAGKQLVAYLVGPSEAAVASVRRFLEDRLPDFLLPSCFICLESLPLTTHGKVDVRALPSPSATLLTATAHSTRTLPGNDAERLLVELWQRLLGIEDVGIHDNFFTLGGHSLLAVQMIEQAHRAGLVISLQQFKSHPTIASMARTATMREDRYSPVHEEQRPGRRGPVLLTPGQQWTLSGMPWHNPHHNAPALLVQVHRPLELALVEHVMAHLAGRHDQLRARFAPHGAQWRQFIDDDIHIPVTWQDLSALEEAEQRQVIEEVARRMQSSMHLEHGPLVQIACFCLGPARPSLLLWVVHHVLVDAYSFHVLLEDFQQGYAQCVAGKAIRLLDPSISGEAWATYLRQLAASEDLQREASAWMNCPWNEVMPLPLDFPQGLGSNTVGSRQMLEEHLSVEETRRLFEQTAGACTITDVLLSGLLQAWRQWTECPWLHVSMIDSGRLEPGHLDRSRSIGHFTLLRRFLLRTSTVQRSPQEILDEVHAQARHFPNGGISLDLLGWAAEEDPSLHHLLKGAAIPQPHLLLNYLGEPFLAPTAPGYTFIGQEQDSQEPRNDILECCGWTQAGQLTLQFVFSEHCHRRSTIQQVADQCMSFLRALATGLRTEEIR